MNHRTAPAALVTLAALTVLVACDNDDPAGGAKPATTQAIACSAEYHAPDGDLLHPESVWSTAPYTRSEASLTLSAGCPQAPAAPSTSCDPAQFPWSASDDLNAARVRAAGVDTWIKSTITGGGAGQGLTQQILKLRLADATTAVNRFRDHLLQCGASTVVETNGNPQVLLLEEAAKPRLLVDLANDRITALTPTGDGWTKQQLLQITQR
ncbi:hypothetical protein PUR71_07335 [Streptomyces sp. SP17BM10]|uniref:hypothetical protein n=1 Tax=Streptomyces sp. SP17BM10 TaxID=3002530 RepID=UPI002E762CBD|nr:hypothetical protein [Streptomyces sp. SP17BM10]MEE1782732.1 hypothetical protein [Streptomyces sp. SP17BM10]